MARFDTPNPIVYRPPSERDQMGLIQGQTPDSINEWFVYLALERLNLHYVYQYSIYGGTSLRGGQVIDFVVFTPVGRIPVFVEGAYWHSWRQDPDYPLKLAAARHYFKNEPVILKEDETDTRQKAFIAVRDKVQI